MLISRKYGGKCYVHFLEDEDEKQEQFYCKVNYLSIYAGIQTPNIYYLHLKKTFGYIFMQFPEVDTNKFMGASIQFLISIKDLSA